MRKLLLSIVALMMCTLAFADEITFDFDSDYATLFPTLKGVSSGSGTTYVSDGDFTEATSTTLGDVTLTVSAMTSGSNPNRIWNGSPRLRMYSGTLTIESSESTITAFTINTAKDKFNATADCGQLTNNGATVTWDGDESKIVLTVSKNTQIKSIVLTTKSKDPDAVNAPKFSHISEKYYEPFNVSITADEGADIYYSTDEANYVKYTSPVNIATTTTLCAYAQKGEKKSSITSAKYIMAQTYASLSDLLMETPTTEGKPVSVTINEEVVDSFSVDYNSARNGVFFIASATSNGMFQLYGSGTPTNWKVGDKISGTAKGIYKDYSGQWEISLITDGWALLSNGAPEAPKAPAIAFDSATKTVTITDPSGKDNAIYYTTDGTDPDDSKTQYEEPFTISATTTVMAICYDDNDQKSDITSLNCIITEDLVDIAALKAACTATSQSEAPTVTFTLNDIKVVGVNGQNLFIQDATGSFLIFDKNKAAGVTRGDVLSGTVTGALYSYNNMPELEVTDFSNMSKTAGDAPQPVKVNASDITKDDASRYVRFEGLEYVSTSSKNITLKDATGQIILYDKFGNLTNITFSADYKYNMNLFVCPFKDDINYYALYEDDIECISEKDEAICRFDDFADNQLFNLATTKNINYSFTVQSDAPQFIFETTDSAVATIEFQTIRFHGIGVATVSFGVPSTDNFTAAKDSRTVRVYSGATGELGSPYCAGDVKALFQDGDTVRNTWVKAYIVGYADGGMSADKVKFDAAGDVVSNIVIADNQNETNVARVIPVELPKGDVRTNLNLKDHPENLGKEVWLKGNVIKYFSQAGLKGVSEYTFDATVINHVNAEDRMVNDAIYNLAGQRISAPQKGQIVIIGGKKMVY